MPDDRIISAEFEGATHEHDGGITVIELPDGPAGGPSALGGVLGVYERHGYAAGYRRAVHDVRLSLLGVAEDLVRARGLSAEAAAHLRRAVWAAAEALPTEPGAIPRAGYVEGGLGI